MTRRPDPASPGYRTGAAIARAAQALGLGRPAARLAWWIVKRWATPDQRALAQQARLDAAPGQRAQVDDLEQRRRARDETPASDVTHSEDT